MPDYDPLQGFEGQTAEGKMLLLAQCARQQVHTMAEISATLKWLLRSFVGLLISIAAALILMLVERSAG